MKENKRQNKRRALSTLPRLPPTQKKVSKLFKETIDLYYFIAKFVKTFYTMFKIGEELKRIRLEKEADILEICMKARICPSTYYNIERGMTVPRVDTMAAVLEALGYELTLVQKDDSSNE